MSITAIKQALEALEKTRDENMAYLNFREPYHEAITALRQAIAEAEKQEPVAWINKHGACKTSLFREVEAGAKNEYTIPLYTHQPKRVPLTDEQIEEICWTEVDQRLRSFARAIEAAHGIKEKA